MTMQYFKQNVRQKFVFFKHRTLNQGCSTGFQTKTGLSQFNKEFIIILSYNKYRFVEN